MSTGIARMIPYVTELSSKIPCTLATVVSSIWLTRCSVLTLIVRTRYKICAKHTAPRRRTSAGKHRPVRDTRSAVAARPSAASVKLFYFLTVLPFKTHSAEANIRVGRLPAGACVLTWSAVTWIYDNTGFAVFSMEACPVTVTRISESRTFYTFATIEAWILGTRTDIAGITHVITTIPIDATVLVTVATALGASGGIVRVASLDESRGRIPAGLRHHAVKIHCNGKT